MKLILNRLPVTSQPIPTLKTLYLELVPYQQFYLSGDQLENGSNHHVYVECCGNPNGIPVLFLHGGPGSGCRPYHRQYFDPELYHIILFDQRGCGRSSPLGELSNNTTADLISDMEAIRQHLAIKQWILFAGSWGTTLALSYAIKHPATVVAFVLRGVFLGRKTDIDWAYNADGAARLFPEQWQRLMALLSSEKPHSALIEFQHLLHQPDKQLQIDTALALYRWLGAIGRLSIAKHDKEPDYDQLIAHFRIQLHYALAGCFIAEQPILENLSAIQTIPTWIVQGQYDLVCPTEQSLALHKAMPNSELIMVHMAGHAGNEPEVIDALIDITDRLPNLI